MPDHPVNARTGNNLDLLCNQIAICKDTKRNEKRQRQRTRDYEEAKGASVTPVIVCEQTPVLIWRLIKERADDSVSEVPGTMSFAELQTKVLLGTSHILRGAFSITYEVIYALGPSVCLFNGQNSLSIS